MTKKELEKSLKIIKMLEDMAEKTGTTLTFDGCDISISDDGKTLFIRGIVM